MLETLWRRSQDEQVGGLPWVLARAALWGLVPLFHGASLAKRAVFSACPGVRTRLPALTVSVGNLTMGGSGKTTMTRLIAEILSGELGLRTAVLSRGYRSANRKAVLPVSRDGVVDVGSEWCGDEAWLLARWLRCCSVVVGRRRAVTGRWAVDHLGARALVLDDGLQYWRLERDVDIVMVSAPEGFGNGYPFPRGPLREPLWGLGRASCIVLCQVSEAGTAAVRRLEGVITDRVPGVPIIGLDLRPKGTRRAIAGYASPSLPTDCGEPFEIGGARVYAFCGLGSPGAFRRTLESLRCDIVGFGIFPDHHVYTPAAVAEIRSAAATAAADLIVTTEKDEANLTTLGEGEQPIVVVGIEGVLLGDGRARLLDVLKRKAT